jgi:type IV pilus assembly protein PilB
MKKVKEILSPILEPADMENLQFYIGTGCERCNGTGYKGRLGIHEVMIC